MRPLPLLRASVAIARWPLLMFATGVLAVNVSGTHGYDGILTRAAAIIFCLHLGHTVWSALIERKVELHGDLPDWTTMTVHRDTVPVLYWRSSASKSSV